MHAITAAADASPGPSFIKRAYYVLKAWRQAPLDVATLCPSSPSLTRKLANRDCVKNAQNIIELGPGAGGTTQTLLEHMRPDARLMVVEKSTVFSEPLRAIDDPRLDVVMDDACSLVDLVTQRNFGLADVVVSGIPFSSMPATTAKTIAESIHQVLRPGGVFIAYQIRDHVTEFARPLFGPAETEVVPMNLPPLTLYTWTKVCMPPSSAKDNGASRRSLSA